MSPRMVGLLAAAGVAMLSYEAQPPHGVLGTALFLGGTLTTGLAGYCAAGGKLRARPQIAIQPAVPQLVIKKILLGIPTSDWSRRVGHGQPRSSLSSLLASRLNRKMPSARKALAGRCIHDVWPRPTGVGLGGAEVTDTRDWADA